METENINIGLLGLGTVGTEVAYQLIHNNNIINNQKSKQTNNYLLQPKYIVYWFGWAGGSCWFVWDFSPYNIKKI